MSIWKAVCVTSTAAPPRASERNGAPGAGFPQACWSLTGAAQLSGNVVYLGAPYLK